MRINLDSCCYGRLSDNLSIPRNNEESKAVAEVLQLCQAGSVRLIGSMVLLEEFALNPDPVLRERNLGFQSLFDEFIEMGQLIRNRAVELASHGLKAMDGLHVAGAEQAGADSFLTVDDRLLRKAQSIAGVPVENPVAYLKRVRQVP